LQIVCYTKPLQTKSTHQFPMQFAILTILIIPFCETIPLCLKIQYAVLRNTPEHIV
jgi:hypothetical protein